MAHTKKAAQAFDEFVGDGIQGSLPVGVAVKRVVGVGNGDLSDREALIVRAVFCHLIVVLGNKRLKKSAGRDVMKFGRLLHGVQKKGQFSFAGDALGAVKVPLNR